MHLRPRSLTPFKRLTLLILCLVLAAGGCSKPLTESERLARAKQFQEEGNLRATMIELKDLLQQNPNNIEARRLLGETYLRLGDGVAAEKEFKRAIDLGLAKEAVILGLAEALQLQGKYQQLLDETGPEPSLPPEAQGSLAAYRGNAWLALGKQDKAEAEYRRALAIDPQAPLAKLGLARLAAADNDLDQALSLVEDALQTAPRNGLLWRYKAFLHRRRGELAQAETAYGKAIDLLPIHYEDLANRALVRVDLRQYDEAAKDIEVLQRTAPKFHLTHFAAGYLRLAQGDIKGAKASLEQALSLNDRYPLTYFYLGLAQLRLGELEQADIHLSRFKSMFPGSPQAHEALALVKYRLRDFRTARSLLMPLLLSQPENPHALNLMANIELASGHPKEGIRYLEKLAALQPGSPEIEARLGTGMLAAGFQKQGMELLEKALAQDPDLVQPGVLLVTTYIWEKNFARAKRLINEMKAHMPRNPLPLNLEAQWYQAQGQEDKAKAALEAAWQLDPGNPNTGENLARLAFKNHRFGQAREIYETVLKAHPDNILAQLRLSELDSRQGKFKTSETRLTRLIEQHPHALRPRLELAKLYLHFGLANRAQTVLEEVRGRYPNHPELLAVLTKTQLADKQPQRALATAKSLTARYPNLPLAHYLMAQAYALSGDIGGLQKELNATLEMAPDFLPARLARVKLLALKGEKARADKALSQLAHQFPDNPEVLALQGWWAMRQHRFEQAITAYRKALAQTPTSALVINLAKAQWHSGAKQAALKTLEEWNRRYPRDTTALYYRASLLLAQGDHDGARRLLEEIVKITPRNPQALNDLAWILRKEAPQKALKYAEAAHKLVPGSPAITDTLAMVALENGQKRRALQLLETAVEQVPEWPEARYHLALAQLENGLEADAAKNLRKALDTSKNFPGRKAAEALLRTLSQ